MFDDSKISAFKQAALTSGYGEDEVNSFLDMAKAMKQPDMPSTDPQPQDFAPPEAAPMPVLGGQNVGIQDANSQTSRPLSQTEQPGIMPNQVTGANKLGVEDYSQHMSRMLTPEEQQASLKSLNQTGNLGTVQPAANLPRVTQAFGNRSGVEKYSNGINLGADFATKPGTPLLVPQGEWVVEKVSPGFNGGSGNFVKIKNKQTGDSLGYEHLSQIAVKPGQQVTPGMPVGLSGGNQAGPGRGNSTGAHSSLPLQDKNGKYIDIMKSPYINSVFGS